MRVLLPALAATLRRRRPRRGRRPTWLAPVGLGAEVVDISSTGSVAMAPDGTVIAAWAAGDGGRHCILQVSRRAPGGSFGRADQVPGTSRSGLCRRRRGRRGQRHRHVAAEHHAARAQRCRRRAGPEHRRRRGERRRRPGARRRPHRPGRRRLGRQQRRRQSQSCAARSAPASRVASPRSGRSPQPVDTTGITGVVAAVGDGGHARWPTHASPAAAGRRSRSTTGGPGDVHGEHGPAHLGRDARHRRAAPGDRHRPDRTADGALDRVVPQRGVLRGAATGRRLERHRPRLGERTMSRTRPSPESHRTEPWSRRGS